MYKRQDHAAVRTLLVQREGVAEVARRAADGLRQVRRAETGDVGMACLLYTSPSPRDRTRSRMPSSA